MTFADIAPVITALGGVAGIGAGIRWWLDRFGIALSQYDTAVSDTLTFDVAEINTRLM